MRVVLAEDQFLLRDGIVRLLSSHGIEVVAAVSCGDEILDAIDLHRPDLALLDIRLPPTFTDEGVRAAVAARTRTPGLPVMLLSQHIEHLYLPRLLATGDSGIGYLLKDRVLDDLQFIAALRTVRDGGTVMDPEVVAELLRRDKRRAALARLTARELEVLARMAEGDANPVIAQKLVVTEKAVAKHINSVLAKLDLPPATTASRRVAAVLAYLRG
ncbi:response regulator transcription factor [Cellulomonas chengniuliangii]|uniref:Response regulator transcription factor n=1 Tax=Cellulomonas chengniuliangii TaxID=2968084 RepID=A0ABY5KZP6_9CELL|nr:response regulator transcription factor [Cellulomonas chengniuliangii]MCC2309332.1 response regulator transcription factor [Cellulomonas chengniuliangii]MCC2316602.1 response regulator transcription factor [Cellulomonas chengniuliangii]UUI75099.1 response regulator transcription factor [Cellulomonas chengniuliangii]